MKKLIICLLILSGITATGCAAQQPLDEGMSEKKIMPGDYQWAFEKMKMADSMQDISFVKAYLQIDEKNGNLTGFAGCNRFFGSIQMEHQFNSGSFTAGRIGSTRMACPHMNQEGTILQSLQQVTRYEIRNKTMLLFKADELLLQLHAEKKSN